MQSAGAKYDEYGNLAVFGNRYQTMLRGEATDRERNPRTAPLTTIHGLGDAKQEPAQQPLLSVAFPKPLLQSLCNKVSDCTRIYLTHLLKPNRDITIFIYYL